MRKQIISDRELISQYLKGRHSSIEILINRYKDKVYSYIFMLVKNKELAEDIFQDTFVKVVRTLKRGKYNEEGKFLPWVLRIAHNLTIDHFRKSNRMQTVDNSVFGDDDSFDIFDTISYDEDNREEQIIKGQIKHDVRKLIKNLPAEQREVLIMRHYADMSFKEIAEKTNVSINTALGRMRYALINLRKMITENNISLTMQ